MNNNIAKICAALVMCDCPVCEEALAALAELEKAAADPVATLVGFDVETGLPADIAWHADCAAFNSGDKLYTTPPPAKPAPGMPEWYGADTPWPLHDVLEKLIHAAGILLDRHDYDGHGHEGVRYAQIAGKEILANILKERTQ